MSLLEEMSKAMQEEDNRATSYPIYVVQQLKSTYGVDPEYAERSIWIDSEGNEYDSDDPSMGGVSNLTRTGIKDEYVFVQPFFTEAGANKYIEENRHNLKHPRVYVESGYRNEEWQAVRKFLKSPTELDSYDKRLLHDLTRMWSDACEVARKHCPVEVGRDHIKDGIPRLAKRAADAEAERDKLRAQIEVYIDDCRDVMPIHWAFAGDEYAKPLASEPKEHTPTTDKTYDLFNEVMVKKPWQPLMNESGGRHSFLGTLEGGPNRNRGMDNEVCKELMQKIDTKIVEELSIASIVKANAELKKRVEILEETVVEYLKEGKK